MTESDKIEKRRDAIKKLADELDYRDPLHIALQAAATIATIQVIEAYARERAARAVAVLCAERARAYEAVVYGAAG